MPQGRFKDNTLDELPENSPPPIPDSVAIFPTAAKEWERITAELENHGTLQSSDMAVIAAYCIIWGRVSDLQQSIGTFVTKLKGDMLHVHPLLKDMIPMLAELRQLAKALGLTPTSRKEQGKASDGTGKLLADLQAYVKGKK